MTAVSSPVLWLLDTCVVSELTRPEPSVHVQEWLATHAGQSALAAVSVGEIQYGLLRLPAGARKRRLQAWFEELCVQFEARILASTVPVWREFGRLKADLEQTGRQQDDLDILIAATACCHKLTLVTRNVRHFQDTGLDIVNPWGVK